ncbi:hypothetical protein HK102_013548 [Quaeritorhiza haematococci]|nr:hypothetical protein HK102_013548 [Quaeritorhiza haematococci]
MRAAIKTYLLLALVAILGVAAFATPIDTKPEHSGKAVPVVNFQISTKDGKTYTTNVVDGPVRAKEAFVVTYTPARGKCPHHVKNGIDSWTVHVGFTTPTGQSFAQYAAVAYVDSKTNQTVAPAVTIPAWVMSAPGTAYFWFDCTNEAGQIEYDSNFGYNWPVEVAAKA